MKKCLALTLLLVLMLTACEGSNTPDSQDRGQAITEQYSTRLETARPYPLAEMRDSLERANLIERLLRFNDASKIGYVYLLSDFGTVVSYFTIIGKVSSVNSQLTTTNLVVNCEYRESACTAIEAMGDDGSYGPNEGGDGGIFFFTTEGVMVEWAGAFLYSDYPLEITEQPVLGYDDTNAAPSSTSEDAPSPAASPSP